MTTLLDPRSVVAPITGQARLALIDQPLINHVVLIVDNSVSMRRHVAAVRAQIRSIITDLREQSGIMKQQIRVTIYQFGARVEVLVFDTDVNVVPDVATQYDAISGSTALLDATGIGLDDLTTTSDLYGDHAFLLYVITDGEENSSRSYNVGNAIPNRMSNLPANWTLAALVPDVRGRNYAEQFMGVPRDNIALWNVNSANGFEDVSRTVTAATHGFLRGRAAGVTGTRTLFSTGSDAVNATTVQAAAQRGDVREMPKDSYVIMPVQPAQGSREQIRPFVERHGMTYSVGRCYYQLTKVETIQPQKKIIVVEKATGKAFSGDGTRAMIGLPPMHVKVSPDYNKDYSIYVQSTSVNRNLIIGQNLLVSL